MLGKLTREGQVGLLARPLAESGVAARIGWREPLKVSRSFVDAFTGDSRFPSFELLDRPSRLYRSKTEFAC
jgi:hypothetical protein